MDFNGYFEVSSAGRVRCERGWSLDAAWSERLMDCDLWWVWEGRGTMKTRAGEIALKPGVCLCMRPGGRYLASHDQERPLGVTYIHFTPRTPQGHAVFEEERLPPERLQVQDPLFFSGVSDKIVRLLRVRAEPDADHPEAAPGLRQATLLFHALILELMSTASDPPGMSEAHRAIIEKQATAIFEQPGQAPSVRELARAAAVSPDHYGRLFRAINGCSPREWIQRARLQRATQLLRETALSIGEIAAETGYADVFQFSRLFKRRIGVPPGTWRTGGNRS